MALIRVMCDSADHNRWFRGEPAAELMKHLFKKELERTGGDQAMRISVYYVLEPLEETRAVAAHYLTLKRQSFNTVSALHIEPHEASDLEITIEETTGDTDIADIDATHRNLIGDNDKFEALIRRLQDALRRGEDRVRVVTPIQIRYQVEEFMKPGADGIHNRAKKNCEKLLESGSR